MVKLKRGKFTQCEDYSQETTMLRFKPMHCGYIASKRSFQECFERAKGSENPDRFWQCYFSQRAVSRVMNLWAISKDWAIPNLKLMPPALASQSFKANSNLATIPQERSHV